MNLRSLYDRDRWTEIWHTIRSNKKRSFATAFGVFWGIFMLVILSSIGAGFSNGMARALSGISSNSAFFFVNYTSKPYKGFKTGRYWRINLSDLDAIRSYIPEVQYASAQLYSWGRSGDNVVYGEKAARYPVMGALPDYFKINSLDLFAGRMLSEVDELQRRKFCMIGKEVVGKFFGSDEESLGKIIRVDGLYYQVVGVVAPKSTAVNMGSNPNRSIFVPFSVLQQKTNSGSRVDNITIAAYPHVELAPVIKKVEALLKERNNIAPDDDKAVGNFDVASAFKLFEMILGGINMLIWIVGIGTLLTGIVGVSNILLVTVRERTREIGVRRALGAKPRVIVTQLLSEALVLTSIAGIAGLMLGVGIMALVDAAVGTPTGNNLPFYQPLIPFGTAVLSLIIIGMGGILGGLLPAYRAIQIKAIDAIRDE